MPQSLAKPGPTLTISLVFLQRCRGSTTSTRGPAVKCRPQRRLLPARPRTAAARGRTAPLCLSVRTGRPRPRAFRSAADGSGWASIPDARSVWQRQRPTEAALPGLPSRTAHSKMAARPRPTPSRNGCRKGRGGPRPLLRWPRRPRDVISGRAEAAREPPDGPRRRHGNARGAGLGRGGAGWSRPGLRRRAAPRPGRRRNLLGPRHSPPNDRGTASPPGRRGKRRRRRNGATVAAQPGGRRGAGGGTGRRSGGPGQAGGLASPWTALRPRPRWRRWRSACGSCVGGRWVRLRGARRGGGCRGFARGRVECGRAPPLLCPAARSERVVREGSGPEARWAQQPGENSSPVLPCCSAPVVVLPWGCGAAAHRASWSSSVKSRISTAWLTAGVGLFLECRDFSTAALKIVL